MSRPRRRGWAFPARWAVLAGAVAVVGAACGPPPPTGPAAQPVPPLTAAPIVTVPALTSAQDALAEARRFVYRVRNEACLATGTAFSYDGTIVTNRHVAAGTSRLDLATWNGQDFTATVGGHGVAGDLARVTASPPGAPYSPAAGPADPAVGDRVFVTGYPEGNQLTVTSGSVLGTTTAPALGVSGPVLVISDRVEPGNSGSPLLDSSGQVVGVVFALETGTGYGLAMPLATLTSFLAGPPSTAPLPCPDQSG